MKKEARYILSDAGNNNNKFWNISIDSNNVVTTHWGRVGDSGQSKSFPCGSDSSAESFFRSKCGEKERKGYVPQRVLTDTATVKAVTSNDLSKVAKAQIKTNSPDLDLLLEFLVKTNAHNIMSQTSMTYNDTTGLFSTPLGIVTQDAIDDARILLTQIGDMVYKKDYDNPSFLTTLSKYMMIIPQNIGRTKPDPRVLYPSLTAVQAQNTILDSLEGSLQAVLSGAKTNTPAVDNSPAPSVFDVKLHTVDDGKTIDRIAKKYQSTLQGIHASSRLKVYRVYEVQIGDMSRDFELHGKQLGNVWELWHGTRAGNLLSILAKGMIIPPSSSPHVTGRMFGDGLYFSDQSTKSLNYAYGCAPGQRGGLESSTFMFLVDVAMGKFYTPTGYGYRLPQQGYDSTFAQAGKSGVMNNEMIVYKRNQANPTFLIEFR